MIKNYLKIAVRSIFKDKLHSFINIFGLAVGLGAFLMIFQFVSFEKSFDSFHEDADRVYRIQFERIYTSRHDKSAGLTAGAGPALKEEFAEIEAYTKMHGAGYMTNTIMIEDDRFIEKDIFYADDSFFEVFSFDLIDGDKDKALEAVNSIVISEARAISYFGKTNVVGEIIKLENGWGVQTCKVTGVFKDLPANTHLDFEILVSLETMHQLSDRQSDLSFGWNAFPTYLKLTKETDYKAFEAKLPDFAARNYTVIIDRGVQPVLLLQPLQDIYLNSNLRFEVGPLGNKRVVKILTGVSLFIIVLAYFNYINLSTSKSLERAKEIGVRKMAGANRVSLMVQFLAESFVLNLIGIILGFTLMQLSLPYFESTLGKSFGELSVFSPELLTPVLILLTTGTLLSGFYPAWIMSKMKTIRVLKGQKSSMGADGIVRKGLVVLQFTILCFLLIGSLAVRSQINYMLTTDRGFNSEQIVVVNGPASGNNSAELLRTFKNDLMSRGDVKGVSNTTMIPGGEISWVNNNVRLVTDGENETVSLPFLGVDAQYVDNLSLEVIAGRDFDENLKSDTSSVMLSRAGAATFGFLNPEEALNKRINEGDREFRIVGVVEDFLQKSFKTGFDPIVFRYLPQANSYLIIRTQTENYSDILSNIESTYKSLYPNDTFNYFFLDEFFERQFEEDRVFGKVFDLFTILGICISILGLFGLTSYAVSLRRKEIGIRKVLGASVADVVTLISRNFVYLVVISMLVAVPVAYYAADLWLSNYSFATRLQLYVFIAPIIAILLITLLTTGSLALRSASKNPVDSLRYE